MRPRRGIVPHPDISDDEPRGHRARLCYALPVEVIRDAIYFEQLARVARVKADASDDHDLAIRLREAAVKHERKARQLRRDEG